MEISNLNIFSILVVLFFSTILIFLGYKKWKEQKALNQNYQLLGVGKYYYIKYIFLILSTLIILFSLFEFRFGEKIQNDINKGIDMTFVLDVSKSMNTFDIKEGNNLYARLDVAKKAISDFVTKHPNDRFGLVIFAGDAISTVPLTNDHDIFLTFLDNVDYRNLIVQGSDFEKALTLGVERFQNDEDRSKAIIFISDGGDESDIINKTNLKKIARKDQEIHYFVAGIGSREGGKIITGNDVFGNYIYQKYQGQEVISKLNEKNLKEISQALNGKYEKISQFSDLSRFDNHIQTLEKKAMKNSSIGEKNNGSRDLAFVSACFFLVFLFLLLFEHKFYFFNIREYE